MNLLTANVLDSHKGVVSIFKGYKMINLPYGSLQCVAWTRLTTVCSSNDNTGCWNLQSSMSQNLLNKSSPDKVIMQQALNCWGECPAWTVPVNTHPNHVLDAEGDPGGPYHQPWRIMQVNTSAPRRRSMSAGVPKPGSAKLMLNRCFQLLSKGLGCDGNSVVIRIIASTGSLLPSWPTWDSKMCQSKRTLVTNSSYSINLHHISLTQQVEV